MKIHFLTTSPGKLQEARARLAPLGFRVESYAAKAIEIQADTLEEVARHKAESVLRAAPRPFFVEDAGLFVDELGGFPGVYSHYAFETLGHAGLLKLLRGVPPGRRGARFEARIAYVDSQDRLHTVAGRANGSISTKARGTNGFGFDPIFVPRGHTTTFAQLTPEAKGRISHRGRALDALAKLVAKKEKV